MDGQSQKIKLTMDVKLKTTHQKSRDISDRNSEYCMKLVGDIETKLQLTFQLKVELRAEIKVIYNCLMKIHS